MITTIIVFRPRNISAAALLVPSSRLIPIPQTIKPSRQLRWIIQAILLLPGQVLVVMVLIITLTVFRPRNISAAALLVPSSRLIPIPQTIKPSRQLRWIIPAILLLPGQVLVVMVLIITLTVFRPRNISAAAPLVPSSRLIPILQKINFV